MSVTDRPAFKRLEAVPQGSKKTSMRKFTARDAGILRTYHCPDLTPQAPHTGATLNGQFTRREKGK